MNTFDKNTRRLFWLIMSATAFVWFSPAIASAQILKPGELIYSRAATVLGGNCDTGAVWAVGQDGSNDRFITLGFHPRISPDGRFLLFKRFSSSSLCSPFGIAPEWWIRDLARRTETQIALNFQTSLGHFFSPETNRAGNQIVFSDGAGICRMNLDGTNKVCANIPNLDPIRGGGHPVVRGSDNLLLVQNFLDNADGGLYTLNYDTLLNRQKIPNTIGRDLSPSWSNDGQKIAFAAFPPNRGGEPYFFTNLFTIEPNGANRTQLTFINPPNGEGFSYSLIWTKDNQTIINAAKLNGVAGIYKIAADGSGNITQIPVTAGAAPEWVGGIAPVYSEQQTASFGAGLTSGDIYSLVNTIGQGFAGQVSLGGTYNFQSGFWHYPPSAAPTAAGALQFSGATYSANENGGTATITVTRSGGSDGAVGVNYATSNGTATAGSDYTATNGALSWNAGEAGSKTFTVPILDDNLLEGDETVNLTLSSPTGGATLGSPNTAILTIVDNEICSYSISPTSQTIAGAGGSASASVTTANGCAWTAASNAAWLTITSGASG
ncbi:MAG: hypothetical protein LH614_08225, partial [Pyrinomonadaceae bacterium]|nr:hypothetical protein [Pyrinomonadaceae bacterium]